jgi:mono/diheme cytochrome c family protein
MTDRPKRTTALLLVAACQLACHRTNVPLPSLPPAPAGNATELAARGEYVVRNAAACGGCHAADQRNPDGPLSGGAEFKDWRLGTIRAANLTSDAATGLGAWSDAEIVRALRNGQRRDGRLLAPVMPYEWLHDMSDADALAVARYLESLPPVRNDVRQQPNLVFKIGKALFLGPKAGTSVSAPPRGPTLAYGDYLANHVALCSHCHTPRGGLRDEFDNSRAFAGDATPPKGFPANPANITPDSATGIGRWTESDFLRAIRTGVNPKGDSLNRFMPWPEERRMTDDDLRAIYRYLRTLEPIHNDVPRRSPSSASR